MTYFGKFIFYLRTEQEVTLKEFCRALKYDVCKWSRIERGLNAPPNKNNILKIARYFELNETKTQFLLLLAQTYKKKTISVKEILDYMPAFPSKDMTLPEIENLASNIKRELT